MRYFLLGLSLLLFTNSCVETVVVGGAATAVALKREKTLSNTGSDILIATKILQKFTVAGLKNPGSTIDITVNEKRVLLTGAVKNQEDIDLATKLSWEVKGVREVIDEVQVIENWNLFTKISDYSRDTIITTEAESKLLFNDKVASVNVKITTVNGVVYLLGVARNESEIATITDIIAKIRGVRRVISHLILIDDPRRN